MSTMIHHIVLIRWREQTSAADIESAVTGLKEELQTIDGVAEIALGSSLGLLQANAYNYALTARLRTREALLAYAPHPTHQRALGRLAPLMAEAVIVDFEA
jgi:hypothetical protein